MGATDGSRAGLDGFAYYGLEVLLELGIFNSKIRFNREFRNETLAGPDFLGTSSDQEAQGTLNALLQRQSIVFRDRVVDTRQAIGTVHDRSSITVATENNEGYDMVEVQHSSLVCGRVFPLDKNGVESWVVRRDLNLRSIAVSVSVFCNRRQLIDISYANKRSIVPKKKKVRKVNRK